jgi:hypothetical protein
VCWEEGRGKGGGEEVFGRKTEERRVEDSGYYGELGGSMLGGGKDGKRDGGELTCAFPGLQ